MLAHNLSPSFSWDTTGAEEFATGLKQDGMLALARLQRKLRIVESPYRISARFWLRIRRRWEG